MKIFSPVFPPLNPFQTPLFTIKDQKTAFSYYWHINCSIADIAAQI